jgi:hypothetical protein
MSVDLMQKTKVPRLVRQLNAVLKKTTRFAEQQEGIAHYIQNMPSITEDDV